MPRINIHLHDLDAIEELEDSWDALIEAGAEPAPRDTREVGARERGAARRFGGAEAIDRKRADRRKQVYRPAKRA